MQKKIKGFTKYYKYMAGSTVLTFATTSFKKQLS